MIGEPKQVGSPLVACLLETQLDAELDLARPGSTVALIVDET
jgi:hypothetical protein